MSIHRALICDICHEHVLAGDGIDHASHVYTLAEAKGWYRGVRDHDISRDIHALRPGLRRQHKWDICPDCIAGGAA